MSTDKIVQVALALVKGERATIPAMNGEQWELFRWWLGYLRGYEM